MKNLGPVMLGALIVALVFGITACTIHGIAPNYSNGQRTGTLAKFSYKGVLLKSYEGELLLGAVGIGSGGTAIPTVWEFSTTDPKVAARLEALMGKPLTLTYRQWLLNPIRISTQYEVVDVAELSPSEQTTKGDK